MRAIIKVAGKQYIVKEEDIITIDEDLDTPVGGKVEFKEILAIGEDKLKFGSPLVENAKVTGEVLEKKKADKIIIFKFKKRKRYHRKQGHRQQLTAVKIIKIEE